MSDKETLTIEEFSGLSAEKIVRRAVETLGAANIVLSSSLSMEDQILTHLLLTQFPGARIFTLDTGRVFQESYDLMQRTMQRYGMQYEIYAPDARELEEMLKTHGPNLFYESTEKRKLCCDIRKVRPLRRALTGVDAWMTGLRRAQSATRSSLLPVEWDETFQIFKINPLWNWSLEETEQYIRENNIPFNTLFQKGFKSIGCAPCTRAVDKGEDERSGRWWWETPDKKECGLHLKRRSN